MRMSQQELEALLEKGAVKVAGNSHETNKTVPPKQKDMPVNRDTAEKKINGLKLKLGRKNKFGNKKTEIDGIVFDPKKEAERYQVLKQFEKQGKINGLKLQQEFILIPQVVLDGKKQKPVKYKADFCYSVDGNDIVEDVKGWKTPEYKIKRKLMKFVHGVEIFENT